MTAFLSIVVLKRRTEKELATLGTSRSRCGPNPRPDCRVLSPHLSHESLCRLRITQPVPAPLQRCYFLLNYKTLNSFLPHARSSPKSIASILGQVSQVKSPQELGSCLHQFQRPNTVLGITGTGLLLMYDKQTQSQSNLGEKRTFYLPKITKLPKLLNAINSEMDPYDRMKNQSHTLVSTRNNQ